MILALAEPGGGRGAFRGGLGRDPSAAPGGADADQGDRPGDGRVAEYGAGGDRERPAAEVSAAAEGLDRGCGRAADPGAAAGVSGDAGDGDRRADRVGPVGPGA